jgi:hypothetical protein
MESGAPARERATGVTRWALLMALLIKPGEKPPFLVDSGSGTCVAPNLPVLMVYTVPPVADGVPGDG